MSSTSTASDGKRNKQDKSGSSSENEIPFKKRKKRSIANGFIRSLRTTQREQKLNECKLRIRRLPENPDEDVPSVAITALNSSLNINLTFSDVVSCERVVCWDRVQQPRDVVVTFADVDKRDHVYGSKFQHQNLPFQIIEELCGERAKIWSEAVVLFGERNVVITRGVIYILTRKKHMHKICTMWQFKTFLRKLSNEMYISPFDMAGFSDEDIYASDTSEELSFTLYESNRKDKKIEKKLRLRNIPEIAGENTKFEVIQFISSHLSLDLEESDVEFCERVIGWDGRVEPRDIAVTFKYKHLQQDALYRRRLIENGRSIVLEELTSEMADIWGEAVKAFGEDKVLIIANSISINIGGTNHPVTSMGQYRSLVKH